VAVHDPSPGERDCTHELRLAAMVAEHERRKWQIVGHVLEVMEAAHRGEHRCGAPASAARAAGLDGRERPPSGRSADRDGATS
jgi:hypothetical protein